MSTPAADGLAMPPEWAPHERTLMAWPCRAELWGAQLEQARADYAQTANAIAAFEPLTMVCRDEQDAAAARVALTGGVDVVVMAIDDSWLRDSGPIFVTGNRKRGPGSPATGPAAPPHRKGGPGSPATGPAAPPPDRRAGVHFGFNAWGGKFTPWEQDAAVGGRLVEYVGDACYRAPLVLEGGSITVDGTGTLLTTEECLLNVNRNPSLSREEIEGHLRDFLGVERIVWLGRGLVEDRDTDGHVDLVAAFTGPGEVLLQSAPADNPNHEHCAENRALAETAGLSVVDFPLLPYARVADEEVVVSQLNFYVCNGAVVVPLAGAGTDEEALERIAAAYPGREAVGVPGATIAFGGGGPHCITQQVPVPG